ncbi:hypothetical protein BD560DRAFT_406180 [Blakeslea trispora]|nr:hypothetical protein BD560DRAFT_406180 [Blakeslea trispora]
MFYIGSKELTDFLRDNSVVDYSLKEFVSKHEDLIVSTNIYNSWDKLRATWVKRYKEALRKEKQVGNASERALCRVEDEVWKQLYQINLIEVDCLGARLFRWCEAKFKGEEFEGVKQVLEEISSLESKEGRSLKECLQVMTCKYLMTFDTLNHLSKCVLKLSVSNVLNLNNKQYADEYQRYLTISQYKSLQELKAPIMISEEESVEIKNLFKECKETLFDDAGFVDCAIAKGKRQQIGAICTMMKNKFDEWATSNDSDDEDEDDSGDDSDKKKKERSRKRQRVMDVDESDIVYVLKEMLNAIFVDTFMRWKSGERTTDATKRSKKTNTSAASTNLTAIKNLMGRRSDLVAYNNKKIPVCLCEVKDGLSDSATTHQESKSIRCSKSLQLYNKVMNGPESIWSLDLNGQEGYLYYLTRHEDIDVVLPGKRLFVPFCVEEVDSLEDTIEALYELRNCLKEYSEALREEYLGETSTGQTYHTP